MKIPTSKKMALAPEELRNLLYFLYVDLIKKNIGKKNRAEIAIMHVPHPVITPFLVRMTNHFKIECQFLAPYDDYSRFRRVIIPNGYWKNIRKHCELIPDNKKIFCEIGFLPQASNIYFDPKGVHGRSSIRDQQLRALTEAEQLSLDKFREEYFSRNYNKIKWKTVSIDTQEDAEWINELGNFVLVPLQLEHDTAFELCPFKSNQEMVSFIEEQLPEKKIVFKMHPLDNSKPYKTSPTNVVLENKNKDLAILLKKCESVVSSNSNVILEALLMRKRCATLGVGPTTNHRVTLECHANIKKLATLEDFSPEPRKMDQFMYKILERQVSTNFPRIKSEEKKLRIQLEEYELI